MINDQLRLHENEPGRIATLKSLEILDTPAAPEFDNITELAARLLCAPIVQISLIDEDRQWLKSYTGHSTRQIPRQSAFCDQTIRATEPLVVSDTRVDPRFAANPFVIAAPFVRFYAGVPLIIDGAAVGSLCVIDTTPRLLSAEQRVTLETLAALVVDQLHAHRRSLQLARSEERFRLAAVASSDAMFEWDLDTDAIMWAAGHEHHSAGGTIDFGQSGAEWKARIHPEDRNRILANVHRVVCGTEQEWTGEYRFERMDGSYAAVSDRCFVIRSASGAPVRVIGAMHDISVQKSAEARLHRAAFHDSLTGLPNRALFLQCMEEALRAAEETGGSVGIIYLDLDDFKDVNDTLGHDAGDAVLREAAQRLIQCVPSSAMVARLGGDEFAILLMEETARPLVEAVARAVLDSLSIPVRFGSEELSSKASLGIALYPLDDPRASELAKNADLALYRAKAAGGNQLSFFHPEMRQVVQQKISALACARDALVRDAIVPFYQPKVALETGTLYGFEALLRWKHPRNGVQSPGLIKEAFDDPALSVEIGRRMLLKVIEDMRAWRNSGIPFGSVAVNVAGQQFLRTDFAGEVLDQLKRSNLPAGCLEIEVTESVFLGNGSDGIGEALRQLHHGGVSISLDDFGTGYASLTHLNKFPLSWIKIDQSFVRDMDVSADSAAIVTAVVGLAHHLGIRVVAEGVETINQWEQLKGKGCDLAQGYLIAKPMSGSRVPNFIKALPQSEHLKRRPLELAKKVG